MNIPALVVFCKSFFKAEAINAIFLCASEIPVYEKLCTRAYIKWSLANYRMVECVQFAHMCSTPWVCYVQFCMWIDLYLYFYSVSLTIGMQHAAS